MKMIFLINATSAKTSGALTVLKDCIAYIEQNPIPGKEYHLITVMDIFNAYKNIRVHKVNVQNWSSRIQWDNGGLQKWCKKNKLDPDAIISLQNTSTKYGKNGLMVTQVVYYHQPIPLYPLNGIGVDFKQKLYHYFYPFFVNRYNTQSHYVVQLPCIKELFCRKFKKIPPDRVTVIRTSRPQIDITGISAKELSGEKNAYNYIYPANSIAYKNHAVLISALAEIKRKNPDILKKINLFFTVDKLPDSLMNKMKMNNIDSCIKFIGQVPYTELLSYYKSADALLFPSKIESLGYPLLEASCFGLPIIACDLPYAREVLEGYANKYFINPDNADDWASAIGTYENYTKISSDVLISGENSWKHFFELVDKLIQEQRHE